MEFLFRKLRPYYFNRSTIILKTEPILHKILLAMLNIYLKRILMTQSIPFSACGHTVG